MKTTHQLITGDSRQMNHIAARSVQLVITSPPYWQLKDYGTQEQIGYHEDYETYINHLNLVWKECHRVLTNGCRLCVNIGDQFARAVYYGRYKVIPIRTEIIKFCESIGFDYMGAIIWQKKTTQNTTGGASLMGSYPTPRNGIIAIDYEFILLFKKLGIPPKPTPALKAASKLTKEEWKTYFSGHWNFGGTRQDGHIAMFPEELPRRLIKMFAFKGDTILDPFMGSGTTLLAARNLERNSIGYEINPKFVKFAKQKLNVAGLKLSDVGYEFLNDVCDLDIEKTLKQLPYRYVDFQQLDKKIDPKQLQFGSKLDENSIQREEYYTVTEVISPELVCLNNNLVVRLIGIKEKKSANSRAKKFLSEKTQKQKVFMKFDARKHDANNNLLCYLYLKNKTFLNAHLIKEGLASPETSLDFKYKNRFLKLVE